MLFLMPVVVKAGLAVVIRLRCKISVFLQSLFDAVTFVVRAGCIQNIDDLLHW